MNTFCLSFAGASGKTREILVKEALDKLVSMGFGWCKPSNGTYDGNRESTENGLNSGSSLWVSFYSAFPLTLTSGNADIHKTFLITTQYDKFLKEAQKLADSMRVVVQNFKVEGFGYWNIPVTITKNSINFNINEMVEELTDSLMDQAKNRQSELFPE